MQLFSSTICALFMGLILIQSIKNIYMEIKSMQTIRRIHQSFISSIKTGSPWDSVPQAGEYPHLVIKDGLAGLTLSSATCTCTQMRTRQHSQPASRLNLSHSGLLTAMQQFSSRVQIKEFRRSYIYSSKVQTLSICTVYTRADQFGYMLFILISCIQF